MYYFFYDLTGRGDALYEKFITLGPNKLGIAMNDYVLRSRCFSTDIKYMCDQSR